MDQPNFNLKPMLVFWESTRACLLACKHCRAEAIASPVQGELSTAEGLQFIESLTQFGKPYPVLIITGGDLLMRPDIFDLIARARELNIPFGLSPSVTPMLTDENIQRMIDFGVKAVSISLEGACSNIHDEIRGGEGHFQQTIAALKRLVEAGFTVQVNTTIMRDNVMELPAIVQILKDVGVKIWELFFLIHVGRGESRKELTPLEYEDVAHFLFEASTYDLIIRTVEGPFFRRIVHNRLRDDNDLRTTFEIAKQYQLGPLYLQLSQELKNRMGMSISKPRAQTKGTRDGKGIIFVAHNGDVYPSGFLPYSLGNVRKQSLVSIYQNHPLLLDIRDSKFRGKCGVCPYRNECGGSRARAYAYTGDPLAEDPACSYE